MDITHIVSVIRGRRSPLLQGCTAFFEYMEVYPSLARAAPTTSLVLQTSPDALPNPLQLLHDVLSELLVAVAHYEATPFPPAIFAKAEAVFSAHGDSVGQEMRQTLRFQDPEASSPQGPDTYEVALQSALLLLKLAELTSSVGKQTTNTQTALGM